MITRPAALTAKVPWFLSVSFVCFVAIPSAAEFTTPITITETDTTHDGYSLATSGARVAVNGPCAFSFLLQADLTLVIRSTPAANPALASLQPPGILPP